VETAHPYLTLSLTSFKSVVSVELTGQKKEKQKKKESVLSGAQVALL